MRRPGWFRLLLLLLLAGLLRLSADLLVHWEEHQASGDLPAGLLSGLRLLALAAAVVTLLLAVLRRSAASSEVETARLPARMLLQAAAGILLAAITIGSLVDLASGDDGSQYAVRSAFRSALLLAAGLWLGVLALPGRWIGAVRRLLPRPVGVVLVNLLLTLLLLEAVALLFASLHPTRLLWDESSAQRTIRANRLKPGSNYYGFPANSGGYYDEEFHRAGRDDLLVALLADSFGLGIVPYKYNFATVIERRLGQGAAVAGRVAVNNYGVAGIGLPEYCWLLEREVPATSPTHVVLGLFVGNDISGLETRRRRGVYSLQQLQLFELGRRLGRLRRLPAGPGGRGGPFGVKRGPTADVAGGTFDQATYLEIELSTVELCNTRSPHMERLYRAAFDWLERIHGQAGDRLLVVLIPDEYQVNDALWEALMARVHEPGAYDRVYPQRRLGSFLRRQGVEVLDLLEPLRQAHGVRPVYRPRDTHWNARGNRVAGEAIARHLVAVRSAALP